MKKPYDSSWALIRSGRGNLSKSEGAFDKKYQEWKKRAWMKWLGWIPDA